MRVVAVVVIVVSLLLSACSRPKQHAAPAKPQIAPASWVKPDRPPVKTQSQPIKLEHANHWLGRIS